MTLLFFFLKSCWRSRSFVRNKTVCCRIVAWYMFIWASLHDWLKKRAPPFRPIKSQAKTNDDWFALSFARFTSAVCSFFDFWLVYCIPCVLCDWRQRLPWFWSTHLKTALWSAHCTGSKAQALCLSNMILKAQKLNILLSKCLVSSYTLANDQKENCLIGLTTDPTMAPQVVGQLFGVRLPICNFKF